MTTPYPTLHEFFMSRFHQDASLRWPSMEENVQKYASASDGDALGRLIEELERLMADVSTEEALAETLDLDLSCYFYPPGMGLTYRQWLAFLADRFREELQRRGPGPV